MLAKQDFGWTLTAILIVALAVALGGRRVVATASAGWQAVRVWR